MPTESDAENSVNRAILEIANGEDPSSEDLSVLLMRGIKEGDVVITGVTRDGKISYGLTVRGREKVEKLFEEALGHINFGQGDPN